MFINILNIFGTEVAMSDYMSYEEFEALINRQKIRVHIWGDDWPHWAELYAAEVWIADYVYKWSKCRLQSKEKWGSLRYERIWPPSRGAGPVIQLPFPLFHRTIQGHKFPRYLFFWTNSWLYHKWMLWGHRMLKTAVRLACKKFPNVVAEITGDLK